MSDLRSLRRKDASCIFASSKMAYTRAASPQAMRACTSQVCIALSFPSRRSRAALPLSSDALPVSLSFTFLPINTKITVNDNLQVVSDLVVNHLQVVDFQPLARRFSFRKVSENPIFILMGFSATKKNALPPCVGLCEKHRYA